MNIGEPKSLPDRLGKLSRARSDDVTTTAGSQAFQDALGGRSRPPAHIHRDKAKVARGTTIPPIPPHSSGHTQARYDELTVFQAAPLIWRDEAGEHPIEMLDFEREREILAESLHDAAEGTAGGGGERGDGGTVTLTCDIATTDRLGAFLATGGGGDDDNEGPPPRALHFSCHGSPEYLCIEDGSGGAQFLMVDDLRELMSAGGGKGRGSRRRQVCRFVFVSACFSRPAGEAFVAAGVPHVVCCQQDEPLMDVATIEFSRNFYRALASGKHLREAFELGRQSVKLSPSVPDAEEEMRKFLLLPEGADHDVPVFYSAKRRRHWGSSNSLVPPNPPVAWGGCPSQSWVLRHPPRPFLGRAIDMYKVLQALRWAQLVRITGGGGVGKISFAAAVCSYINIRKRSFSIDEVVWLPMGLPLDDSERVKNLSSSFHELFDLLRNGSLAFNLHLDAEYRRICGAIIKALHQTKALILVDTRDFTKTQEISKLSIFLQNLLQGTRDVKVILISRDGLGLSLQSACVECQVALSPLGFESSATLFGSICPFVRERRHPKVRTARQLSRLLVPKAHAHFKMSDGGLSKRSVEIFRRIGEGVPAKIHAAARDMTRPEFDELIEIGERKEYSAEYALVWKSRAELEQQLARLKKELNDATSKSNFARAKEVKEAFEELKRLRETLPDLSELRRMEKSLAKDLKEAVSLEDFGRAEHIHKELADLKQKIEQETKATNSDASSKDDSDDAKSTMPKFSTRAELEAEIRKVQRELEGAVRAGRFRDAHRLQLSITDLERNRESILSSTELSSKITDLSARLDEAIGARDPRALISAESIYHELKQLRLQLYAEKEIEAKINPSSGAHIQGGTPTDDISTLEVMTKMKPHEEDFDETEDAVANTTTACGSDLNGWNVVAKHQRKNLVAMKMRSATASHSSAPKPRNDGMHLRKMHQHASKRPITNLSLGDTLSGQVKTIMSYGAFLDVGYRADAFLHISKMSDSFVSNVESVVRIGDRVNVRVLSVDAARNKLSVSMCTLEKVATRENQRDKHHRFVKADHESCRSQNDQIRVDNISSDTSEYDLEEIFKPFGEIEKLHIVKDKRTHKSRGVAFVSFVHKEEAQLAMDKLQRPRLGHLILKLDWVKPRVTGTRPHR